MKRFGEIDKAVGSETSTKVEMLDFLEICMLW